MSSKLERLSLLLVIVLFASCKENRKLRSLPPLGNATFVEVRKSNSSIATITDPVRIKNLVSFVDARRNPWQNPWYGVPGARVDAMIYDGDQIRGTLGIGDRFLVCQCAGAFAYESLSPESVKAYLDMLGMAPEQRLN
jgi:hypothetical protein